MVLRLIGKRLRRFGRARRGHAAVEFGLVAMPFFLLTFGLAEVAMVGFAQTSLDHAVSETARRIRTGQSQGANESFTQVQTSLCTELNQLLSLSCANNLYLDVNSFPSFVTVTNTSPIQNGNFNTGGFNYNPGQASSIVVVRAYYRWHIITPLFDQLFSNVGNSERVLSSTMMFRNEPF